MDILSLDPNLAPDSPEREGVPEARESGERNKILKVAITLVLMVATLAPFVGYVSLELPILGSMDLTLFDTFRSMGQSDDAETPPTIIIDYANVHKGPGKSSPIIGQANRDQKVSIIERNGDWCKVLTSEGYGWIESRYIEDPAATRSWDDSPEMREAFDHVPPYSPWLPPLALGLVGGSLLFLPFSKTQRQLTILRTGLVASAVCSLYALVWHLLLGQALRSYVTQATGQVAEQVADGSIMGSLVGALALSMGNRVRLEVGPGLYMIAASCGVAAALSLFLLPMTNPYMRGWRSPEKPVNSLLDL